MFVDYILNGQGHGEMGKALEGCRFDAGLMRPFFNDKGVPCVTVNTGRKIQKNNEYVPELKTHTIANMHSRGVFNPTFNATTLRKDEWIYLDRQLVMANRQRLRAWTDLAAASSVSGFDGMAHMTYEYEAMSDTGEAMTSMDGMADGRGDAPAFALSSVPLPIDHVDFYISQRKLAVSRNSGTPLSVPMIESAGRRLAERAERRLIGTITGPQYGTRSTGANAHRGNSQVYGYTNFPYRMTKTDLTTPTGSNPGATVDDILEMREQMYAAGFYGPFMVYTSTDWDRYLDDDYGNTTGSSYGFAPSMSLRERIKGIEGIQDVRRLDFLDATTNPYTIIMVQMTADVAQAIDAMSPRTIQWETRGGFQINFRVFQIQVAVLKFDYNENCGILHATTS